MKVKLCNSLFEAANIREQTDTTGQAKLSERPKRRISVKLTIWLAHLCQFVPGTKSHNWVASRVKNRTVSNCSVKNYCWQILTKQKFIFSDMDFKTLNLRFQTTWKPCFRSKMFVWFTTWLPCTVWANWCSLVAILWIATLGTWYSMKVFQIWAVTALEPSYRGL